MIYEALQQPDVLLQAMTEVIESQSGCTLDINTTTQIDSLCRKPLLQSMYAETLRLYTSLFSLRSASHTSFGLGDFQIPKDELVAVDSRVAAMNASVWNTGAPTADADAYAPHPLNCFWAHRFLVFPDDPTSGPLRGHPTKPKAFVPGSSASSHDNKGGTTPRFTTAGLSGAWVPYGGGNRQCPGRNFAKLEIIVGFAIVLSTLEIELLDHQNHERRKPDLKYYGLGTLPPKGKIPFRVRRREPSYVA
jgi:cytochrome P450